MSNNENKNEQFKSLKEIEAFLRDTSRPFVNQIALTKSRLKDVYDKVSALKQEKIQQSLDVVEEDIDNDAVNSKNDSELITENQEAETVKEVKEVKPAQSEPVKSQTYINPEMLKRQNTRPDSRPSFDKNKTGAPNRNGAVQKPFAPNKGKAEIVAPALNPNFKNN